jgi:hypothetical protein
MLRLSGVTTTYGRFVLEEGKDMIRLRVRSTDSVRLIRAVAILCFAFVVICPAIAFANPVMVLLPVALSIALGLSGQVSGTHAGVARSRYARVRHLVEACWKEAGDGPFRTDGGGPTLTIDGLSFASSDFVGVVTATSTEWARAGGKYDKRVARFRPTLVLRGSAFELDVFEGGDEASGRELSDAVASAISRRRVKAPSVAWHAPHYQRENLPIQLLQILVICVALVAGTFLAFSHSPHVWITSVLFALFFGVDLWAAEAVSRDLSRARSAAADELLVKAKAALALHAA